MQIKSTDFRIGNLVKTDFSETNLKTIVELKHKAASVKYIRTDTNEPHQSMIDYERLIPIPLTEAILLKCPQLEHIEKFRQFNFEVFSITFPELDIWCIDEIKIRRIKYLHEFQNFYKENIGEELQISL